MKFERATKRRAKLRLAISGLAGSGKSWTSLAIAQHLVSNGRVAVIDTERGSASLYANKFQFDVLELEKFSPVDYIQAIELASSAGYDVVILDSFSHAWLDALEKVDQTVDRGGGNNFTAWRKVSPAHNKLVDAILSCPMHVIATMRSKTEYAIQDNDKGKKEIKKLGLAPVQRAGVDYEFTIAGDLNLDHQLLISKSRADVIPPGEVIDRPGEAFAKRLRNWLNDGAEAVVTPIVQPAPVIVTAPVTTLRTEPHLTVVADAVDAVFSKYLADVAAATDQRSLDKAAVAPGKPSKGSPNYDIAVAAYRERKEWLSKREVVAS